MPRWSFAVAAIACTVLTSHAPLARAESASVKAAPTAAAGSRLEVPTTRGGRLDTYAHQRVLTGAIVPQGLAIVMVDGADDFAEEASSVDQDPFISSPEIEGSQVPGPWHQRLEAAAAEASREKDGQQRCNERTLGRGEPVGFPGLAR